ncbi:hypothetical protein [Fundidesulfovibrio terrae]|uniref:hypothetical protein n=1 Tax=Fundidesulfovibrio terrae TaxID=2922866 RepID=UPI001FAFDA1C|nr:hypothetical protein [Fundidesulfovibrio terrae]
MRIDATQSTLLAGMFARPSLTLDSQTVQGFAHEMTRRAAQTPAGEGAKRTVDDAGFEKALTNAVGFVKDNFDGDAARAVMGIVTSRAGSGQLTEDTLGQGFVDALEFVDRNFGTASGDKALAFFNGELNQALNGYFQNGKDESFLVKDTQQALSDLNGAMGTALSSLANKFQAGSADAGASLMDQADKDLKDMLDEAASGSKALVDENGRMVTEYSGTADASSSGKSSGAADATKNTSRARSRLARRRTDSANGYSRSGLTPGLVLNASA